MEYKNPVLVLAPLGRDAEVAAKILSEAAIEAHVCFDIADLLERLPSSGCTLVTEEALLAFDRRGLAEWIRQQQPWSDYPFVLLTLRGDQPNDHLLDMLGNVTLIERPFHPLVLVNAVRSALRARRKQLEVEAYLREREKTAERQALLIRELHHRVKNTLATVQGLLGGTKRSSQTIEDFYHSFSDRIVSLAKTHTLLTEDYWQMGALHQILNAELGPYDAQNRTRVSFEGPYVELTADQAVPIGMAIHELTTNAAKHGALSTDRGQVRVSWDVLLDSGQKQLHLEWVERGGPPVSKPERKGFGSTLLQRVIATQCNAEVQTFYEPEGLRLRMEMPLATKRLVPHY